MSVRTYKKTSCEKISRDFSVNEFACKGDSCCKTVKIDDKLITVLQKIRTHFDKPVIINSAYRCSKHNKNVGGASKSNHLKGKAADIVVKGVEPKEVAKYAEHIGVLGIGLYDNFVHIDTRSVKTFWYGHEQAYRYTFGGAPKKTYEGKFPKLPIKGYISYGDVGSEVLKWQRFLVWYGYKLRCDGIWGADTNLYTRLFQRKEGLKVDEKLGKNTLGRAKIIKK